MPSQFPKQCRCCSRIHQVADWSALELKGIQKDEWEAMELRNCQCKSTLAVIVAVFKTEGA